MYKKSQAALEFLTTYGWAFIIITISISALYYFGIFDFGKYVPQKCIFPSQFKCLDFSLRPTQVKIKLINNLGEDVCIKSLKVTNNANPPLSCVSPSLPQGSCAASEFEWIHATKHDMTFTNCQFGAYVSGDRAEVKVEMDYYAINTPTKPIHKINGKINGKVTST